MPPSPSALSGRSLSHVEGSKYMVKSYLASISHLFDHCWTQIIILAFIGFGSRGMWSALNALGGAGTREIQLATLINTVYSAGYCLLGWMAGGVVNLLGPRLSILVGCLTMAVLATSFYLYAFHRAVSPAIVVGAAFFDGVGATFLWSAVSVILLFYPRPCERGRAMSVFNLVYNSGTAAGALLAFFMNKNPSDPSQGLSDAPTTTMSSHSYLQIIFIMYAACGLCTLLREPHGIFSRPADNDFNSKSHQTPLQELSDLWRAATNKYTAHLFFIFLVTTWHLVFLFNWMNASYFNVRSRAMNSAIYWIARLLATFPLQFCLDSRRKSFRKRGFRGFFLLFALWLAATVCGLCVATLAPYAGEGIAPGFARMDIADASSIAPLFCFILFGALDTVSQSYTIWVIGALPIDPAAAARICGVYRSLQGFGQMLSWILDINHLTPYRVQFAISTFLWIAALVPLLLLIHKYLDPLTLSVPETKVDIDTLPAGSSPIRVV